MELYLPVNTAHILLALCGLCVAAAFCCALTLLDTHERQRAEDAAWSIWRAEPDGEESPADDEGLPPLSDALAWFALPATPRDVPALPPQARVVARCDCNASVARSRGNLTAQRGDWQ